MWARNQQKDAVAQKATKKQEYAKAAVTIQKHVRDHQARGGKAGAEQRARRAQEWARQRREEIKQEEARRERLLLREQEIEEKVPWPLPRRLRGWGVGALERRKRCGTTEQAG